VFLYAATNWANGEDDHVVARAEYDFLAASEGEISVRAGDMLNLAPKGEGSLSDCWFNTPGCTGTLWSMLPCSVAKLDFNVMNLLNFVSHRVRFFF